MIKEEKRIYFRKYGWIGELEIGQSQILDIPYTTEKARSIGGLLASYVKKGIEEQGVKKKFSQGKILKPGTKQVYVFKITRKQ